MVDRLRTQLSQNALINIVTIVLGLSSELNCQPTNSWMYRRWGSCSGMAAFCMGTAAGVLMAKLDEPLLQGSH